MHYLFVFMSQRTAQMHGRVVQRALSIIFVMRYKSKFFFLLVLVLLLLLVVVVVVVVAANVQLI